MSRTVLHVAPSGLDTGGFSVRRRGSSRRIFTGTQREAVSQARDMASSRRGASQIIVHNRAGRFARSILVG